MDARAAERSNSSAPSTESVSCQTASAGAAVTWRAHPAAQRPAQAVLAAGIVLVVAGSVYVFWESAGLAVLGVVMLTAALNRFFFPSRFSIDDEGISASYPFKRMRYRWSELNRFAWDEYGGYLSTRAVRSRLDAFRGMHLLFDDDREQIVENIRNRMSHARAAAGEQEP